MAKSKRSESTASPKKTPARKAPKAQKSAPAAPAGLPMIDTDLAAQAAARMLAARAKMKEAGAEAGGDESGKESAAFNEMKKHLQRPAAHVASTAMGNAFGQQKTNLPQMGRDQSFHSQTTGQGASRVNVPRRTAG